MRDISSIQNYLDRNYALEPVIVVEVAWGAGVGTKRYAKKVIEDSEDQPWLVSINDLSMTQSSQSFAQIESSSIELRDLDQTLRGYVETQNIEGKTCRIYQSHEGIDSGDEVLLLDGKITGPITWSEGSRILSFDVITRQTNVQVGREIDHTMILSNPFASIVNLRHDVEGLFPPIVLGAVVDLPAVRITRQLEATLANTFTVFKDTFGTTSINIDVFAPNTGEEVFERANLSLIRYLEIQGLVFSVIHSTTINELGFTDSDGRIERFTVNGNVDKYPASTITTADRVADDPDFADPKVFWIDNGAFRLEGNVVVINTQPSYLLRPIRLFNRCVKQVGRKCFFESPWTELDTSPDAGGATTTKRLSKPLIAGNTITAIQAFKPDSHFGDTYYNYLDPTEDTYFQYDPGTTVRVWSYDTPYGFYPEIYLVSQKPINLTSVKSSYSGQAYPIEIPYHTNHILTYYSVDNNWGSLGFVALTLKIPLSEYGEGWDDNILITARSGTGVAVIDGSNNATTAAWGNVAYIIKWLIQDTPSHGYTVDADTFAAVATVIDKCPAGFAVTQLTPLFTLIGQIAYLSRCVITLDGNVISLRYISTTPPGGDYDLDEEQIQEQSMQLAITETTSLTTKLIYTFQESYRLGPIERILYNNIPTVGKQEQTINFFIYNCGECADVSAGFFLKRASKVWRQLTLTLPLDALALTLYDIVEIDLSGVLGNFTNISESSILGEVRAITYSVESQLITATIELPYELGSDDVDPDYWDVDLPSTRPRNPAARYLRKWYVPPYKKVIPEPHKVEAHNVNTQTRWNEATTELESSTNPDLPPGLHNKDVLVWNAPTAQWVPQSAENLGSGGSGGPTVNVYDVVANVLPTGWPVP